MPMLVIDGIKYSLLVPKEEKQLEEFVKKNYTDIFGKDSLYFDIKPELRSQAGIGSKPDGIVVVFDKPSYYVVENERAEHGVHDHVITQISKFNTAFKKPETKRRIAEAVYNEIRNDPLREYWIKSRVEGELYKFLTDLFSKKPIVAIIIDELLDELREAVDELPLESKIIEFKTFVREDAPNIHAHLFNRIAEALPCEEGFSKGNIEQKKSEMLEYIQSDELKELLSECLKRFMTLNLKIKPLKGPRISVWYKGNRFIVLSVKMKFLRLRAQEKNGTWLPAVQIRDRGDLESAFTKAVKPTLDTY